MPSRTPILRHAIRSLVLAALTLPLTAQPTPQYISPSDAGPHGAAPGMWVKLLSEHNGQRVFAVMFRAGDEPFVGLTQFAAQYHLQSAHFTAIGGFHDARLAWFDEQKKMFRVIPIDDQVEVASLIGDIALLNGQPSVHMHCVVAYPDGQTRGGHILGAHVSPLLEVFVTAEPTPLIKKHNPETGLSLMEPGAK
jgi:uncharacterized protein